MGLIELASYKSVWRGYEYYKQNNVITHIKESESQIRGMVRGSGQKHYDVFIDLEHPRKSKCNCPHADGKRVICKHMISLYFAAYPKIAQKYYDDLIAYEEAEEARQEELEEKLINYVCKLKKEELRNLCLELLYELPEWQFERFIRDYIE